MKKGLGIYTVISMAFSFSPVIFGMDPQHPAAQQKPAEQHHHHHLHLADVEKKMEKDSKIIADVVHTVIQKGDEVIKENPQVIAAMLTTVGVKQQDANNITNTIEKVGDIVAKEDDSAHTLVQKLEQGQVAKNAQANVADALAKK